jgi:flavin reductase (DIM6/NTAB) family NADH-FMN oxidoreductase RutF/DNA-binding IclR family transcriptional regulator
MDARELRNVFGSFVTGVTVVTTTDINGVDHGVTANSFSSVSLDPPLILWSQAKTAKSFSAFQNCKHFIVNILAEEQLNLSQRFASSGVDKFQGLIVQRRLHGLPALPGCCAYIECSKVDEYPGGDHLVYLGKVLAFECNNRRPLAFARGKYMTTFEHEMSPTKVQADSETVYHNQIVRMACLALPEISSYLDATVGIAVWGNRGGTFVRWEIATSRPIPSLRTGIVVSPLSSATGLLFNAILPSSVTDSLTLKAFTALKLNGDDLDSIKTQYEQELQLTRIRGFAVSHQSGMHGRATISAPVYDSTGHLVLALSAISNSFESNEKIDNLGASLKDAALNLSLRLGHKQSSEEIA